MAAFVEWVTEEVLEAVDHRQYVWTIPRVLRPAFRKDRKLLGCLSRRAWVSLRQYAQAALREDFVPGAVVAIQTYGDELNPHEHIHLLASDSAWRPDGGSDSLGEARRMLEASRATDLVTSLYAAGFGLKGDKVMRRLLQEGYLGDIMEVRVTSLLPAVPEAGAWLVDPEVVGVNTMMLGILGEVVYRWIDPPRSVTATTGEDVLAVPQSLSISAELQGGATASFHMSFRVPRGPGSSVEIYGTGGVLDYKLLVEKPGGLLEDEELVGMTEGEAGMHPIEMPLEEQRDRTMDAEFIEAIRNGTPVSPDFAEGVRYMEFCEAVAQSIYEGRTISMPPEPKMDSWGRPL